MDESKVLWILDFLADKAKEFVQISDRVIKGERSLQARDEQTPSEWSTCSTISAFINYVAETERFRYGHFACDLERKNNEHKMHEALNVLRRMELFWEHDEDDAITDEQKQKRQELIEEFLANDFEIKEHLAKQPDMYEEGVTQETNREWSIKLKIMGEKEASFLRRWQKLLIAERAQEISQIKQSIEAQ